MKTVVRGGPGVALVALLACSNPSSRETTKAVAPEALLEGVRTRFHFRANGEPALTPGTERLTERGELLATKGSLASVEYPARADAPVHVVDAASGLDAHVAVVGATSRAREQRDGLVVYRDALDGAPIIHRPTSAGTEDFVVFERAPASARVSYSVSLGEKVAGLRLVGNVVELLDAGGAPRLRVASPWLVGRDGDVTDAKLAIEGCKYDPDPAPPWGRATVDPGARTCTVQVTWDRDAVVYPALLDPAWQSAGTIGTNRNNATVTRCTRTGTTDRVLVAGGTNVSGGAALASAEVFNATMNSWAATASMVTARYSAVAAADPRDPAFASASIVVTGGRNNTGAALGVNEQWNCSTGAWSSAGTFAARWGHALTFGPNTRLFAVGGRSGTSTMVANISQIDFGSSGSWSSRSGPARAELTAYSDYPWSFPNGSSGHEYCVIWMGGRESSGAATNKTGYLCDGVDGEYSGEASMPLTSPRFGHKLVRTASQILLIGGSNGATDLATVDIFTPGTFKFGGTPLTGISAGPPMPVARNGHVAIAINANDVLVAGGAGSAATTSHLYLGGSWLSVGPLLGSHANGIVGAALPGDGALVVGGPSSPERWARRPNGTTCTENGECATGFCVDGVCCNNACSSTCQSCTAALKGGGSDGTCGPTRNGGADAACPTSSASTCAEDGTCNGAGACRKWPAGTECVAQSCSTTMPAVQNNRQTCNGTGTCSAPTTTTCAAAYVCSGAACATSCTGTDDSKCAAGHYCNGSTCVPATAKASTCTRDRQCASGFCTDGVCCEIRCGGICEACSAAFKGSGVDGECGLVPANTDPRNQCAQDPGYPTSCKSDGMCNGAGACRSFAVADTNCGTDACTAGKATKSRCNGGGVCNLTETSCAPASCNSAGTACAGGCSVDTDCAATAYCDTATSLCVAKKPNGEAATEGRLCQSGIAADGVCCNTACTGTCEACDDAATKGTCTAVAGKARHGTCPGGGTGEDACKATACDGTDRTTCAAKDSVSLCREASCVDGVETLAASCNGTGACPAASSKNCQPYACGDKTCKVKCAANSDCGPGFFCDPTTGICGAGASCVDDTTLKRSDGTTETCVAFKCSGTQCLKTCTSTTDCQPGYICNSGNGQCEAAPAVEDDGGCALGSPAGNGARGAWILIGLAALGVAVRSRRRDVLVRRPR